MGATSVVSLSDSSPIAVKGDKAALGDDGERCGFAEEQTADEKTVWLI